MVIIFSSTIRCFLMFTCNRLFFIHFIFVQFSSTILILALTSSLVNCNEHGHLPIQFDSRDGKGAYNFGYDTGVAGAHQFHQETRDEFGRVRGRYGYTDPNGKLRLVYYSSGVNGYKAWGNVPGTVSEPDPGYSQPIEFLKAPYECEYR